MAKAVDRGSIPGGGDRSSFESFPLPHIIVQENKIVVFNKYFSELIGLPEDAPLAGKSLRNYLTKDSLKSLQELLQKQSSESVPASLDLRFIKKSESGTTVEIPVRAYIGTSGDAAILQFIDLRDQNKVLEEAASSVKRYETLFARSTVPVAIVNGDQIVGWNPAFLALTGIADEKQLAILAYESLIMDDDRDKSVSSIKKLLKRKNLNDTLRYSLQRPDGSTVPVAAHFSRLEVDGGDEILIQHHDYTSFVGLEVELDQHRMETDLLAEFVALTHPTLNLEDIASSVLSTLTHILAMEAGGVYLLDKKKHEYNLLLQKHLPDDLIAKLGSPVSDEGLGGFLTKTLEARIFPIGKYPSYLPFRTLFRQYCETVAFVPIVLGSVCTGFIVMISKKEAGPKPSQAFFTTLSHELGKVIEAARGVREKTISESEVRAIIESAPDVLYRANPDGTFVYLGPAIERLSGYEGKEFFRNKTLLLSLVHRDDKKYLLDRTANIDSVGNTAISEFRILPKGKAAYRWIRDSATILRDSEGNATGIVGILSDITNYKNLADELVQTNELNNSIVSSVREGVVVFNDGLKCIQWNEAMERITGLRKEDVLGRPVGEIFEAAEQDLFALMERALKGENVNSGEVHYRIPKTDREIFVWGGYGPLRDAQNEILGVVGIVSDLSERKSLERELKESEQVLRNVIDTMGDILMITDLKGDVIEINMSFLNSLGYTRHEVIGQDFPYPWLIEEEMGRYVLWIGTLRDKNWLHDFDMTWRSKDDRLIPMSLSTTLLRNSLGEPIAMVNIARDITERKRLAQDVETRKNQVEMLNRIISAGNQSMDFDQIFANISHEIRNVIRFDEIVLAIVEDPDTFKIIATSIPGSPVTGLLIPKEKTVCPLALSEGRAIVIGSLEEGTEEHETSYTHGYRSQITLPITVENRALGTMTILSRTPDEYDDQHLPMLQSIASQSGSILDRILLFRKVSEDATYIHNLLDSIDSIVYTVDAQYRILEVNQAFYEFIRESGAMVLEDYNGVSIFDALPDDAIRRLFQTVAGDILSGVVRFYSEEFTYNIGSGNRVYQVTMNPMVIDRKITGLVISHSDITKVKRTNEQLVALNQISTLFSTQKGIDEILATALPLLVKTLDCDAAVVYLARQHGGSLELAHHHGFSSDESRLLQSMGGSGSATGTVIGTNEPVFVPRDIEGSTELLPQNKIALQQEGMKAVAILPLRSKDKVLGALTLLYKKEQRVEESERQMMSLLGNQLGTALDNAGLYDELRSQVERLTVLYEFSEQLTSELDPNQIYNVVVDHVARLIPFSEFAIELVHPGEAYISSAYRVGKDERSELLVSPDTSGRELPPDAPERRVLSTRHSDHDPLFSHLYVPMASKHSLIGIMSVHARHPFFYGDTHLRLLESIANLTAIALEKGKLYEETIQKSLEIERRNQELDDFTYVVSHDLKEPLISIEGFSKILQIDYRDQLHGEGKEYLDSITGASVRMKALIDDLLMLSRVSRPGESFKLFSVGAVIQEIITDMEYSIRQRGVQFIVAPDLPSIAGNETHMKIVFRNLIGNALKFNRSEHPVIEIGFQNRENISYLFFVKDNGIGINPEFFEKIFTIFQRLHRREEYEGTGAGLAIVKKIIELHKGRIWLESEPGVGSTFYFTLPQSPYHG